MRISKYILVAFIIALSLNSKTQAQELRVSWENVVSVSKTTPTLQLVENPKVRNSSPIHEPVFKALKDESPPITQIFKSLRFAYSGEAVYYSALSPSQRA